MCRGFNLDGNQFVSPGQNKIKLSITTGPVKQIHVLSDDRIEKHRSLQIVVSLLEIIKKTLASGIKISTLC
jgi:hypothetical protein